MRKTPKFLILAAAVAATAALLLAGCQNQGKKDIPQTTAQKEAVMDSTAKEDTMAAFYERMWRMKVLLRGAGRWESDK